MPSPGARGHRATRVNTANLPMRSCNRTTSCALLFAVLAAARAGAAPPSPEEQYLLELLNRFRLAPRSDLSFTTNILPTAPATWGTPKSDDPYIASSLEAFGVDAETLLAQWR